MKKILSIVIVFSVALSSQARAELSLTDKLIIGAGVLGVGAAVATSQAGKSGCVANDDGTEDCPVADQPIKVSLKDKAALVLQRNQTKELRKNLAEAGEGDAPKGCAAHHIVP